ncbi:N-acetylglucosamine-1-phosphotransferase subunit gamma [Parasteatoda tepidariorum]|uniref:N-acetylglucosamine-1-phosphotransferase subunit gamma n=1 Tax=Parasteatoda tepidariorum TaxID=114398 RepID=UPI001C71AFD7|nr:N-acetylglucosamine-1-phosphotransferase subunit gamma [Parasteatoda tepidariorum]
MLQNFVNYLLRIEIFIFVVDSTLIQMRVVKDTAIYGYAGGSLADSETTNQLTSSVQPSNFSGPLLMKRLNGKCYNLTEERYRYIFCPFQNVTQYEVSTRWNAYQGILGVWSHWKIENNTFSEMIFKHGDQCGAINRSIKVRLKCGPKEELLNVTEPSRCEYSAVFSTRYVCHEDALLVYPRLDVHLKKEWDKLYSTFISGDLTLKGYNLGLQKIFLEAGYSEVPVIQERQVTRPDKFMDLLTCNKEYTKLHDEISKLNEEVEHLNNILMRHQKSPNRTTTHV